MRAKSLADRRTLVRNINRAFGRAGIRNTARRLKRLKASADFLDITNALGFLASFTGGDLRRYRRELAIPEHIRRLLTLAFRTALWHEPEPIPLRIAIVSGRSEAVQVAVTGGLISIRLTRSGLSGRASRQRG